MVFQLILLYIAVGAIGAIVLRWPVDTEGLDLALDILLWPLLVYYYLKERNG